MRARSLLVVLLVMVPVVLSGGASAADAYDEAIDLTFPVGGPSSFIDDYHFCRGGAACPRRHRATDIMAPYGATVYAAMGGTITWITGLDGNPPSYGYMISIAGDDGRRYSYIHLGRQDLGPEEAYAPGLANGDRVERGQAIGINGCSGNASCTAPHLHFEIEDRSLTDPYGTHRMNPYASLLAAQARRDLPSGSWLRFADVPSTNVHARDIERLADENVTRGCNPPTNDRFCPGGPVTRGQMAAFLNRAVGLAAAPSAGFRDVPAGSTFAADIDRLAAAGITRGCNPPTNDQFCPEAPVTRQQMSSFLVRGPLAGS